MYNPYFGQMNPYQFPNAQNQFPGINQSQFVTKQVSNIEEAKAFLIDPLSTYLFVDMNSGKIYLKRMNNNGLSDFYTFSVETPPENKTDPFESINERLSNIENILGGQRNVKSISGNADDSESKQNVNGTNEKSESETLSKSSGNDQWEIRNRTQTNGSKHR